jgi:predicted nucleotidyltransferase
MKRDRALRYAREIAARLHQINGIFPTPNCNRDYVAVKNVWVFGSTAKGAAAPNDLDLLIDVEPAGDTRIIVNLHLYPARQSLHQFLVWLTRGMQKCSRHVLPDEAAAIDVKFLIYPRWELPD